MRRIVWVGVIGLSTTLFVASATPAVAEVSGPCDGSATWSTGLVVNARDIEAGEVIVVPRVASVTWSGSINLDPPPTEPRAASGYVRIKLPFPIGQVTVGDWSDTGTTVANSGSYDYELTNILAGFKVPVTASHWEGTLTPTGSATCTGSAVLQLEGTNPAGFIAAALTVISIAGVYLSVQAVGPAAGGSSRREIT